LKKKVVFYGGPRDREEVEIYFPPESIRIETEKILGFYHLKEGIAGFEYHWTRPRGTWTPRLQKKLDAAFPKK